MSATATAWTICPECITTPERALIESTARRQGRGVELEPCSRCDGSTGPRSARELASYTALEMVHGRRSAGDDDVSRLVAEMGSVSRRGLVELALLLAEDLVRERRKA